MTDRLTYFLDNRAPAITRTFTDPDEAVPEPGDVLHIRIRPVWSNSVVVDEAMTVDFDLRTASYQPDADDFSSEGIYKAWVTFNPAGDAQDTDEFEIAVFAHAPGDGVRVGAVWQAARALSPVAWDALRAYRDYGDIELQRIIELAKLRVLRRPVAAASEISEDPRVIDFIAKKLLIDNVLPAAIDYWTSIIVMQSARASSNEIKSYPDRIKAVEGQIARFEKQLDDQVAEIDEILGSSGATPARAPVLVGGGQMISPNIDLLPIPNNLQDRNWRGWDGESDCR